MHGKETRVNVRGFACCFTVLGSELSFDRRKKNLDGPFVMQTEHKMNKSRKLLLETAETGPYDFVGTDDSQGCCRASTRCSSSDQAMSRREP
jgi:hypothetical protein